MASSKHRADERRARVRLSFHDESIALGRAIRARRKQLRLTQIELGRFAGCGVAFLYELEAGKPTLRLDKVLSVLEVLGLRLRLERGKGVLTTESGDAT